MATQHKQMNRILEQLGATKQQRRLNAERIFRELKSGTTKNKTQKKSGEVILLPNLHPDLR